MIRERVEFVFQKGEHNLQERVNFECKSEYWLKESIFLKKKEAPSALIWLK